MDVTEQLPDIHFVSTLEAEERIVTEIDFLFFYLYSYLHGYMFKASDKSLTDILQVVVTENQAYLAIESVKYLGPFRCTAKTEVAEMEDNVVIVDRSVPVGYQCLVHFCHIIEGTLAVADYICVVEVGVGCKEHPTSIEFEIHCQSSIMASRLNVLCSP